MASGDCRSFAWLSGVEGFYGCFIIANGSLIHFSEFVHCLTCEGCLTLLNRAIIGILSATDIQYSQVWSNAVYGRVVSSYTNSIGRRRLNRRESNGSEKVAIMTNIIYLAFLQT